MTVRDAFFHYVYEKSNSGMDIKVVTPDLGAPSLDDFRRDYPERYISVGIAEQNLIAVAAGLACSGERVVAYGLNPFPVTRAYDQVRNLLASHQFPVILAGLNAGTCSAQAGYTHMPIEDYTLTRCLEGLVTVDVSCEEMARCCLDYALSVRRPVYVRFDKRISGAVYPAAGIDFSRGYISTGTGDTVLASYGFMARKAGEIREQLGRMGVDIRVVDIFSTGFDREALMEEMVPAHQIVTLEDNVLPGGFGSMVLELLSDHGMSIPVLRKGIRWYDGSILQDWQLIHDRNGLATEAVLQDILHLEGMA